MDKIVAKLDISAWPGIRQALAVMQAIAPDDHKGAMIRFVGGCIRNALSNQPITEIDLAASCAPDALLAKLAKARIAVTKIGLSHGTIAAHMGGKKFEITSLRRDVASDGRHAIVAFDAGWEQDALRRDFTMNALYADFHGRVFDPLGGLSDIKSGIVRFIGDPEKRIIEDYLRILRFFRFSAWFAQGAIDAKSLSACAGLADGLGRISRERIGYEMLRLLAAAGPIMALRAMRESGVLAKILTREICLHNFARLVQIEQGQNRNPGPLRRLLVLNQGDIEGLKQRFCLTNRQYAHICAVQQMSAGIQSCWSEAQAKQEIFHQGRQIWRDGVLVAWCRSKAAVSCPDFSALSALASWSAPEFPLRGSDLLALGLPSGPQLGAVLRQMREIWIGENFQLSREQLQDKARMLLSSGSESF